jgi:hypothetical protein
MWPVAANSLSFSDKARTESFKTIYIQQSFAAVVTKLLCPS